MEKQASIRAMLLGFCLSATAVIPAGAGQIISVPAKGAPTIQAAMIAARAGDTVLVANGVYKEKVSVKPGVLLKAQSLFGAAIDGNSRGTVVILAGNAGICGCEIRNGTIGVLSRSIGNSVIKCRITGNWGTGVSCEGRLPKIEDNLIVFNRGSGIQGWDVIASSDIIDHNTIAYNANNGVAFGGASSVIMENNIIAFNSRFGVKTDETVKMSTTQNDFFQNGSMAAGTDEKNFAYDPKFSDPRKKMDFSLQQDSPLRSGELKAGEIGARLSY
jgi:Periplasmic copper-binding protein (NosD)